MYLIIAEKSSAGKKIASCIRGEHFKAEQGYLKSENYYVSWCAGHLYELFNLEEYREDYDPEQKYRWTMDGLPFIPAGRKFRYKKKNSPKTPSMNKTVNMQVKVLKALLNDKSVTAIYHAGDADREGEVIVRNVLQALLKSQKPVYRIWLNAYTPEAMQKALNDKEPDAHYDGWFRSGRARAYEDWLLGINGTRYLSLKAGTLLPWGRCKYIIVKAIVDREREIRNFVPTEYYGVVSEEETKGYPIQLTSKRTFQKDDKSGAQALANKFNQAGAKVTSITKKATTVSAGKLFSTTALQAFVSKHFKDVDPKDTENALEELYQAGYTTYPRTNSQFLTKNDIPDVERTIAALKKAGFVNIENKTKLKSIYDDSKVDGHSALTPTSHLPDINRLTTVQKIVYESIRNRFLAVFCSEKCIADETTIKIQCADEEFSLSGSIVREKGWMQYEPYGKKDKMLPPLNEGDAVNIDFGPVLKKTTPPQRFTVESFGAWCQAPWRKEEDAQGEYSDEEWERILHEATICTDATRTPTITECRNNGYIKLVKNVYHAEEKGEQFVDACEALGLKFSVKQVMDMSSQLFDIRKGSATIDECLDGCEARLQEMFSHKDAHVQNMRTDNSVGKCPKCGNPVREWKENFSCGTKGCLYIKKDNALLKALGCKKKTITTKDMEKLCQGKPILVKGCVSKRTGKEYDANLILDVSGDRPEFKLEFANTKPATQSKTKRSKKA